MFPKEQLSRREKLAMKTKKFKVTRRPVITWLLTAKKGFDGDRENEVDFNLKIPWAKTSV
jgi:hypothetical protein